MWGHFASKEELIVAIVSGQFVALTDVARRLLDSPDPAAALHAVGFVPNPSPDLWRRYLAIIFDGLRPEGASALPHPAPGWS